MDELEIVQNPQDFEDAPESEVSEVDEFIINEEEQFSAEESKESEEEGYIFEFDNSSHTTETQPHNYSPDWYDFKEPVEVRNKAKDLQTRRFLYEFLLNRKLEIALSKASSSNGPENAKVNGSLKKLYQRARFHALNLAGYVNHAEASELEREDEILVEISFLRKIVRGKETEQFRFVHQPFQDFLVAEAIEY